MMKKSTAREGNKKKQQRIHGGRAIATVEGHAALASEGKAEIEREETKEQKKECGGSK